MSDPNATQTVYDGLAALHPKSDPNKAAVTESNAQFVARIRFLLERNLPLTVKERKRLIALAEERVMIEEHRLCIQPPWYASDGWSAEAQNGAIGYEQDLSAAICAVVAKIGGKK